MMWCIILVLAACFQNVILFSFEDLDLKSINLKYYRESEVPKTHMIDDYYEDIYMPYLFDTGVGNRERLVINDISVDESFPFGDDVIDWRDITFGGRQYLVGKQEHKVILIQVKIKLYSSDTHNTLYFNETFTKFDGVVGPIALTKRFNYASGLEEGFALVTESNQDYFQCIHWFKMTNRGLDLHDTWWNPTRGEIVDLKWISIDFTEYLLIVTQDGNGSTTLDLSEYKSEENKLRLMCKDKMTISSRVSSISSFVRGEGLYLALVTSDLHKVQFYRYYFSSVQAGGFKHLSDLANVNISEVKAFSQSGRHYFLTNGDEPNIYIVNQDESLTPKLNDCGSVEEWLILEVPTYREDVILLARDKSKVSLLTWSGSQTGFTVTPQPPCYTLLTNMQKQSRISDDGSCLTRCKWSKATALNLGHVPSLILACKGQDGTHHRGLYHFNVSLHPVHGPAQEIIDVLALSRQLKDSVTSLSQEFENEGLMEDITVTRGRLEEGWTGEWRGLEHCLSELDQQVSLMNSYMQLRRHNNVTVSLSLNQGKLRGFASGLLANQSVETQFNGKMKMQPESGSNSRSMIIDSDVILDKTEQYSLKAKVQLGLLDVMTIPSDELIRSNAGYRYGITPEVPGPSAKASEKKEEEKPLHAIMVQDVYDSN